MHILKIILLILALIPTIALAEYPSAKNEYMNDFAQIIDDDIEQAISKKLYDVEYYSGVEISVATIENYGKYGTGDSTWEAFSTGLFNHWGVGNLPENNGVLFLISEGDRKIRIELGAGYPSHYDTVMKSIIDTHITPLLKSGMYTEGVIKGVGEIINATTVPVSFFEWYKWYILAGIVAFVSLVAAFAVDREKDPGLFLFLLASAGLLIIAILKLLASGNRSSGFGSGSSRGGGASGSF